MCLYMRFFEIYGMQYALLTDSVCFLHAMHILFSLLELLLYYMHSYTRAMPIVHVATKKNIQIQIKYTYKYNRYWKVTNP